MTTALSQHTGRVRPGRLLAAVLAGMLSVLLTAAPSWAATGAWPDSRTTSSPTIYQTNLWYSGTAFNAPASVPSNATITSVTYTWTMLNNPPAGLYYNMWLCRGTGQTNCYAVNPGTGVRQYSGTVTGWNGQTAKTSFQFVVQIPASSTYTFPAPYYPSSSYYITVNYTY